MTFIPFAPCGPPPHVSETDRGEMYDYWSYSEKGMAGVAEGPGQCLPVGLGTEKSAGRSLGYRPLHEAHRRTGEDEHGMKLIK